MVSVESSKDGLGRENLNTQEATGAWNDGVAKE